MKYLSLWEKLKILFDLFMSYKFIFIITILMLIFTILFCIKKLSGKKYIVSMFISLCIAFIISIINNYNILSNTFDNFTTILFNGIYFPSIYVYIGILLIVTITFMVSILNKKSNKAYKIVNSTMFILNNILLVLLLNIIANNRIDIFSISSLYTSESLVSILELNMGLFILWIASIIVIYITNVICSRISLRKEIVKEEIKIEKEDIEKNVIDKAKEDITFNDILNNIEVIYYDNNINNNNEYEICNPQEEYESNYDKLVEKNNVKETIIEENNIVVEESNTTSLNDLIEEDKEIKEITSINNDNYTLEDYKKILNMLKELKENRINNITVDDAVTLSLINDYSIDDCVKFKEMLESNLN